MSTEGQANQPEQPAGDATEQKVDNACERPEIHLAADAVKLAKLELQKAQKYYNDLCNQATEKIKAVRETTVGEVVDCTLEKVKKHPGPSLIVCAGLGFCLGRWFQKLFKK